MRKTNCQQTLVSAIEAMGEIYTFAEKSGLSTQMLNTFFHSVFAHPAYKLYADKIKQRHFSPANFSVNTAVKDLKLFQEAFAQVQAVPDIVSMIKNKFITALAQGMGEEDWSAVTEITRLQAGLTRT